MQNVKQSKLDTVAVKNTSLEPEVKAIHFLFKKVKNERKSQPDNHYTLR